ncbi:glycosyltransferase family 4 protein [Aquipseudomonas alcaligenes]|uniref:glycosyltransferase family 4 protein n=1 Tax=Aquipseudomonas alcaligenes TaxID=43263 RepID=UPI00077FFA60|nr:glycosyltransferase family 1 protein [Pseudomonas alcaligenes]AMR68628.1 hypothetical protein A0T30_02645 [Pseudomonas alcaligenes]
MGRLLVECSNVFRSPAVNTGIQRVVRNIVRHLDEVSRQEGVECIPVVMAEKRLFKVERLLPNASDQTPPARLYVLCEKVNHAFWGLHGRLERYWPMTRWHNARRASYVAFRLLSAPLWVAMKALRLLGYDSLRRRASVFEHQSGDHLVLLDSSWHASCFSTVEGLKRDGVSIVAVVHDLIPLVRPEFSEERLRSIFTSWFDWMVGQADGFVGVSCTVRDHVRREMGARFGEEQAAARWYGFFHHGCELDLIGDDARPPQELADLFASASVYLAVSTIEPRKNHEYLLDAFELAWGAGSEACLCIIGRIGWKREALIKRIREHAEFGRRLFMFNDVTDSGLQYAYGHARALVFASHDEGFGLPLVEAMQRGLPVMGSDIPVFREIGGDYMAYFDLSSPQALADLVQQFESSNRFPAPLGLDGWQWNDWREACRQMVKTVQAQGLDERDAGMDATNARSA